MATFVRPPAVAGQFYPGNAATLRRELESFLRPDGEKLKALGCLVPHAGYMYSGHVAGAVFGRLELTSRYIILCPNHTGFGQPLAIMDKGRWATPLGEVPVDTELAQLLMQEYSPLAEDYDSQRREHALEVQLPFLQELVTDFKFVPITVGVSRLETLIGLGDAIARVLRKVSERIMIVASSDMNHYENDATTRVKDARAIDPILALDPVGLYDVILNQHVTMCGFGPAIAMLTATKKLGAKSAQLIKYATSGDISGDKEAVVGYAGIAVI